VAIGATDGRTILYAGTHGGFASRALLKASDEQPTDRFVPSGV
jgi:hypothetical protein